MFDPSIKQKMFDVLNLIKATKIEASEFRATTLFTLNNIKCSISHEKDRLVINAWKPTLTDGRTQFHGNIADQWDAIKTKITVAIDADNQKIANSILNRIDWTAIEEKRKILENQLKANNDFENKHKELVSSVETFFKTKTVRIRNGTQAEVTFYPSDSCYGEMTIEGLSVDFRIRGIKDQKFIEALSKVIDQYS